MAEASSFVAVVQGSVKFKREDELRFYCHTLLLQSDPGLWLT